MSLFREASRGARLSLPRDLQIGYVIGRMGVVRLAEIWRLFWGSPHTARFGMNRLQKLGVVRSFPRLAPSLPAWYALTSEGREWVIAETGGDSAELPVVGGIARLNLATLAVRNAWWASVILAARSSPDVTLALFRPERELRAVAQGLPTVPDCLVTLRRRGDDSSLTSTALVELDSGCERRSVMEAKARGYVVLRSLPTVYGVSRWRALVLVPSRRRALVVARAMVEGGAGAFTDLGVTETLLHGAAFAPLLWRADRLAAHPEVEPRVSLIGELVTVAEHPDQLPRSGADRPRDVQSSVNSCG